MSVELAIKQKPCDGCRYYKPGTVFDLCTHEASKYVVAERDEFHTVGHMRRAAGCGPDAIWRTPL